MTEATGRLRYPLISSKVRVPWLSSTAGIIKSGRGTIHSHHIPFRLYSFLSVLVSINLPNPLINKTGMSTNILSNMTVKNIDLNIPEMYDASTDIPSRPLKIIKMIAVNIEAIQ